ncbi:MAG: hypothetical protein JWL76_2122 [Thermoleophilia bacterium]|nr:hypothetical protein [Thermoleophilia bacterium]
MTSNLTMSAQAYAAGDDTTGRRLFDAAFLDIAPLVRMVVARHVEGPEDRDDAFQQAMSNIWRAVQRGVDPAIELYARGAAIDRFRREYRHDQHRDVTDRSGDDRTGRFEDGLSGGDGAHERFTMDDHVEATLDAIEVARVADVLGEHRELWGDIIRCLAQGMGPTEAATHLGRPAGTVKRNVVEIRAYIAERRAA